MPGGVCIIAAMELKKTKKQHSSKLHNASIRALATKFVTARFDAGSKATIPARNASRLAGFSTVTASGATAAGLDRCAYTLGKWQNNIQPAQSENVSHRARNSTPDQISSHFPDIVKSIGTETNLNTRPAANSVAISAASDSINNDSIESPGDTESADKKTPLVVRFDRMERRSEKRQQARRQSNHEQKPSRAPAIAMAATVSMAAPATPNDATVGDSGYTGEERRVAADRREFTLQTMWHCLKNPRRSNGRRRTDRRYPLLDVFDGSAMFLAVALITLSLCDAFFTLNILSHGGREVNPIMNYMLNYGTFAFVASKMLLTALAVVVMTAAGNLKIFRLVRVRSVIALLIGLYAGLIIYELLILAMV